MAHKEQRLFCENIKIKYPNYFKNKKILDIGSLDINGSNKILFENCEYIGLDLGDGKNVDVICSGHLYDAPTDYFDTIISTEAFEHDMYYEKTIDNIIRMLKPGGLFLFTCAAPGRPEHGTRRTGGFDAPLLIEQSEEWSDYYKNLTPEDIRRIPNFDIIFPDGFFEINNSSEIPSDLYFYGIKGGTKYLTDLIIPQHSKTDFDEDIFVIDLWIDNESKENDLINLIKRLKNYNIPILLTGHYPIKVEIQKMVDYYLFDKNNPLLINDEFQDFGINSVRWTDMGSFRVENHREYHHDYAIWETMRNAFNFCKFLNKKYIHFLEYDNLPHPIQYRQTFLERIRDADVVLYEYTKGSISEKNPYCATYIFSIRTDVAVNVVDQIKTKDEFFRSKPDKWQLEKNFLNSIIKLRERIFICKYIPNEHELNTQAVWNRNDIYRNGIETQFYLAIGDDDNLFLHVISGDNNLIELTYSNFKHMYILDKEFLVYNIGKYQKGQTVKIYHQGIEIFNEFLGKDVNEFKEINKIVKNTNKEMNKNPLQINTNFIDGPFVEILFNNIDRLYHVEFINKKNNHIEFQIDLKTNHWAKCSKKYYIDWLIKIRGINHDYYSEHEMDYTGKRVLISFESKSLGDTLAWIGYVEKFRTVHKCIVICSTFHNNLFRSQYPEIEFVEPGTTVPNVYGVYRLGVFKKIGYKPDPNSPNEVDYDKHLTDPKMEPLTKVASDILGLDFIEIKPKLPIFTQSKKKIVSIAIHATAQCKYWNNPNGWQEVVNFLVANGYQVKLLSSEENGFMGNRNPTGIEIIQNKSLEQILKMIQESELFIGISSGLAWLAWGARTETILISGFTDVYTEPTDGIRRVINKNVCNSCWSKFDFNPGDWNWCPVLGNTDRIFECSKTITSQQVINEIKAALKISD